MLIKNNEKNNSFFMLVSFTKQFVSVQLFWAWLYNFSFAFYSSVRKYHRFKNILLMGILVASKY